MSQRRINRTHTDEDLSHLEDAIKECVRFIFCREGSKIPIKRTEIIKHLTTACETPNNQVNKVIAEADKTLKKVTFIIVTSKSNKHVVLIVDNRYSLDYQLSNLTATILIEASLYQSCYRRWNLSSFPILIFLVNTFL